MTAYSFSVRRNGESQAQRRGQRDSSRGAVHHVLEEGSNLQTGLRDFEDHFGEATSLERDLLVIAAAVLAADRASPRGEREEFARTFALRIGVANLERLVPLTTRLERVLRLLSQDSWTLTLAASADVPERDYDAPEQDGRSLLFSGGLDSLAAAVEFGTRPHSLQLVSHTTHNSATSRTQAQLADALVRAGYTLEHRQFFVSSRSGGPSELEHAVENTQRTRSFLFLVLGALAARRTGQRELVYLAENGQMAIHLPLTHGRIGAFSTHTAHPAVLASMEEFLTAALSVPIRITNPYVHRTKREVVQVIAAAVPSLIPAANSCWMNARLPAGVTHCGICVPCYVRRIAIESLGPDATTYNRDIWSENIARLPENDDGRRNLVDLTEFIRRFRTGTAEELLVEFPDLYSPHIDAGAVIEMYRRFASEADAVLGRYQGVAPLLQ